MPTATELEQQLQELGFRVEGQPGFPNEYVTHNERVRLAASVRMRLSADKRAVLPTGGRVGSVYVHPPASAAGGSSGVIVATGRHQRYLSSLYVASSGETKLGAAQAWRGDAAKELLETVKRKLAKRTIR